MSDEQNNQSVKDILEDIKKAISGKNGGIKQQEEEVEDILHLEEEYEEEREEEHDEYEEDESEIYQNGKQNEQLDSSSYSLKEESGSYQDTNNHKTDGNGFYSENNDQLILKENMEDIKALLGKMQSELQKQQQNKPVLTTVEELVISLLKPELSEWLNKHLYELVKEVVEKELKDIIKK